MSDDPRAGRDPRPTRLRGIRACVFDAYGTLFDFASATARGADIPADVRPGSSAADFRTLMPCADGPEAANGVERHRPRN
jgi:hypothetical protein